MQQFLRVSLSILRRQFITHGFERLMDRKAALCCTFSILLASCGGGGGSGDLSGGGGTTAPTSTDGQIPSGLIQATDGNFYGTTSGGGQHDVGTIFRLTPAGVETVLYSFVGGTGDGEYPEGLIQGQDGNFYGTTNDGGVNACTRTASNGSTTSGTGCGVIFKVTPAGAETIVYFFKGGADGGEPNPGLVQASDGTLYGTSLTGGLQGTTACGVGCGNVFRVTTAGAESAVYNFTGTGGDGSIPTSVIVGTNGNLYGTTYVGGQSKYGTIFELTVGGAESQLYSFQGAADGAYPSTALTEGTDGALYGTEPYGGSGRGTVFEVGASGGITTLYSFNGSPNDGAVPGPLTSGTGGHFYGITDGGGVTTCSSGCGTVFEFTAGVGESTLFQFPAVTSGSSVGSPIPYALIQGTDGNLYGTTAADGTYSYGTVYRLTATGSRTVVYSFGAPNP